MSDEDQERYDEASAGTCPVCGSPVDPDDQYCRNCGSRLRGADAMSASQEGLTSEPVGQFEPEDPFRAQETASIATDIEEQPPSEPVAAAFTPAVTSTSDETGSQSPARRTWIIVGVLILIALILCCCALLAISFIAAADSSFQNDVVGSSRQIISQLM